MAMTSDRNAQDRSKIRKLDASVINKIAAGEIITQPSNALKELIENAIDANSTMIDILVKDGGSKLLHVSDNGSGISKEDLKLLCERFATSKIEKFNDLQKLVSYGFRGEALASISHIARLSVITKQEDSPLAYKAFYAEGGLTGPSFRSDTSNVDPRPVAGKNGTQVIIEDMFYNVPSRRRTLKSKTEEFNKILDVSGKYAIYSAGVGFSCKKFGDTSHSIFIRPTLDLRERIRTIYGAEVATELIEIEMSEDEKFQRMTENYGLKGARGAISNLNYNSKKRIQPIFFVNKRLVSIPSLKKSLLSMYNIFVQKGIQPFIYLSLDIEPQNVDVNIHPTKSEVHFLHEEDIIDFIRGKVYDKLSAIDTSRKFTTPQSMVSQSQNSTHDKTNKTYRQENKLVRVDASQSKINYYIPSKNKSTDIQMKKDDIIQAITLESEVKINEKKRTNVKLKSIASLTDEVIESMDKSLTTILSDSSYIGIIDDTKRLCCFQYDVKLYICNYASLLTEFFYQLALSEFCNFGILRLDPAPSLEELLDSLYETRIDLVEKGNVIGNIFAMKDMFEEYFMIRMTKDTSGYHRIETLPLLLKDVRPTYTKLPHFLYRLGSKVNYDDERECLQGVLRQIALFYVPEKTECEQNSHDKSPNVKGKEELDKILENHLFPLMKQIFLAPLKLSNEVVQIADLPGLYRVFERC